jgi:hypothetical protein
MRIPCRAPTTFLSFFLDGDDIALLVLKLHPERVESVRLQRAWIER